ncbi:MAG TPA: serine--tRNA ligase, partial [Acidimicrobiales bacterium]|nr:serine--tRNA ligase [Acidimicrobiales bacterium]
PIGAAAKPRAPRLSTVIDMRLAREESESMRAALARKGRGAATAFDELLMADRDWREARAQVDNLRSRTKPKGPPTPQELEMLTRVREELKAAESDLALLEERRDELLARVPNPPHHTAPDGATEEDAVEIKRVGNVPDFPFTPRDHLELGSFEMERAARLSGSRFAYRVGDTALLELAMYRYALDQLIIEGFEPMLPPVLVRQEAMYGTGFLPTDESNLYQIESDQLYLTGTSEVALAGYHMGEILEPGDLPLRYAGYSTCFRREAGAAGKDTRGVIRVHQFDKVEMFVFTRPSESEAEHERILAIEENLVRSLGIPYRVVNTAAGDLGPSAAKKYDIEAWIPSQGRYREITSCSNTTDYQARRLKVRVRADGGTIHPHTLNGTAMTARWMIAVLENFQDEGGRVAIPEALVRHGAPKSIGVDR